MLKDLVEKYTKVSLEDNNDQDEPLDEVEETEVEETEEVETPEEKEDETQEEQSEEAEVEEDEADDSVETEEAPGDVTVLEAPTDEQGEVSTVDAEEVVSEIEPSEDVQEAGDAIGQETPADAFEGTDDTSDITEGSDTGLDDDTPLEGAADAPDIEAEDAAVVENTLAEGAEIAEGQDQIVQDAIAQANDSDGGEATDVNGNAITEEEAQVNEEEERISEEIDAANEEEVEATDVTGEETPLEEAEELAEEMADETTEGAEESTDDSFSESGDDAGGADDFSGGDSTEGDSSDMGDDGFDDDTPLDGAEDSEVGVEDADVEGAEEVDTEVTEGDTSDVQESVDQQNEASDVTAEAASSDVNDTDAIKGEVPGVSEGVGEDDDTPLDGSLDVEVDDTFKDKEVDGNPSYADNHQDDTAATVEETIDNPDGTEESLASAIADDAAEGNADLEASVDESEGEVQDSTDVDTSDGIDDVEQSEQGTFGEVEDVTGDADFDEGEVDIPDVDMDTTDDEVAEAFNEAEDTEIEADKDEAEAIDATKTIEELQQESESLEHFIKQLEEAISTESYDARRIAVMQVELGKRKDMWGESAPEVPALEDYGHQDLDLLYKASLESFRGFMSRVNQLRTRLIDQLERWWNSPMVTKVVKRADAVNKAIDKALVDLKESEFSSGDVNGISGYLSTDKDSLTRAVADDLKYTTGIATKGLKGNEKLVADIVRMIDDVVAARSPKDIKKVVTQVGNLKSTKSDYPGEVFNDGKLFGGWKLEFKQGDIGDSGIPVAVRNKSGDRKTSFKLTKADVSNLLLMAKTYTALAKKCAETTGDKAVEEIPAQRHQEDRALPFGGATRVQGEWADESKVDDLVSAMMTLSKAHHDVYKFIVKHCLDVAEALIAVASKAAK